MKYFYSIIAFITATAAVPTGLANSADNVIQVKTPPVTHIRRLRDTRLL